MHRLLRRLAVGIAAAVTAVGIATVPAAAEPATITVQVTAADTGQPVTNVCVTAIDAVSFLSAGTACSAAGGAYVLTLDSTRQYKLSVGGNRDYVAGYVGGGSDATQAPSFSAPSTQTVALARGGSLVGRLLLPDGSPAAGFQVSAEDAATGRYVGFATTFVDGSWETFNAVPAGQVKVSFRRTQPPFEISWAYGVRDRAAAAVVSVSAGQTTRVDDTFVPTPRGDLTGIVKDFQTRQPVAGICVDATPAPGQSFFGQGRACTDATGTYTFTGLQAGSWILRYSDATKAYAVQYSGGTYRRERAEPVEVVAGTATTAPSVRLSKGGALTGVVLNADGVPATGVCPSVRLGRTESGVEGLATVCADETGAWSVGGLPPKRYTVSFVDENGDGYLETWAPSALRLRDAAVYELAPGQTVEVGTVTRVLGAAVSGRVVDSAGQPVAGAVVDLDGAPDLRAGGIESRYAAQTDADGRYTVVGVPAGTYRPVAYTFPNLPDYAPSWLGGATDQPQGQPVRLATSATASADFVLPAAARLEGPIRGSDGAPIEAYGVIEVFTPSGISVGFGRDLGPGESQVASTGLPAGSVRLSLDLQDDGAPPFWYDGAASLETATAIPTANGQTSSIGWTLP